MKFPRPPSQRPSRRQWMLRPWSANGEIEPGSLLRVRRAAMACWFEVLLPSRWRDHLQHCRSSLAQLGELESQMTVFDSASEICRLNREAFAEPQSVESGLMNLLELAVEIGRRTAGAFDISAAPLSRVWGFEQRQGRLPSDSEISELLERVGSCSIEINRAAGTIRFERPLELNLGGIGKGYALDRVRQDLQTEIASFLIHAGCSTIWAQGDQPGGEGWSVGVRDPLSRQGDLVQLRLRNQALSSSGAAEQKFSAGGRDYGHVIDPRTGRPAATHLSATAIAPTAAEADALSTAFFIMTLGQIEEYCRQHPGTAAVILTRQADEAALHTFATNPLVEVLC